MLAPCGQPLWDAYDLAMLDLDGVVYIGSHAVPGAPEHLARARAAGMALAYVTNSAARPPATIAEHLCELGIPADAGDVVTSAQAAARLVVEMVPPGSAVYVIGGQGLFEALVEHDLKPVQTPAEDPRAVVSGYHPDVLWKTVVDGAILVRRGLPWVASNTDLTIPTAAGIGPGNGVLVNAVAGFAGTEPVVAGKPQPPLFAETQVRVGGQRPLVVGDRLDTDIEGAVNSGLDSLLVMTGVTGLEELVRAEPGRRPSYVGADLASLGTSQPAPRRSSAEGWRLGSWSASVQGGHELRIEGKGSVDDWWRVAAVTSWHHLDTTGGPVDASRLSWPVG